MALDTPVGEDGENTIGDLAADSFDLEQSITDRMQQRELEAVLWPIVESLSEQQAETIRQHEYNARQLL
ncbi:MAG: hypothetical protein ACLTLE_07080 [Lachnospiraceae bacterium]